MRLCCRLRARPQPFQPRRPFPREKRPSPPGRPCWNARATPRAVPQSCPGGCSKRIGTEATDPQAESGKTCFHTGQFPYPHREPGTRGEGRTRHCREGNAGRGNGPRPAEAECLRCALQPYWPSAPYPAEAAKKTPSRCGGVRRGKGLLPKEDVNRGTPRRRGKRRPGTSHPSGASRMRKGRPPGRGRRESPANRRDRLSLSCRKRVGLVGLRRSLRVNAFRHSTLRSNGQAVPHGG